MIKFLAEDLSARRSSAARTFDEALFAVKMFVLILPVVSRLP